MIWQTHTVQAASFHGHPDCPIQTIERLGTMQSGCSWGQNSVLRNKVTASPGFKVAMFRPGSLLRHPLIQAFAVF
jgi:hypothetical protein